MDLIILNPSVQPFGLLSNNAVVDVKINGEIWKTITQYVYVNMFKDKDVRMKMSTLLKRNPFIEMVTLRNEEDLKVYKTFLKRGMEKMFSSDKNLTLRLFKTRGYTLDHSDEDVLEILNELRMKTSKYVYDPLTETEISLTDVSKVISGVEKVLEEDPFAISDDETFENLRKYSIENYKFLNPEDEIFLDVNNIVPIIKYRLRERLWDEELKKFKNHLLDVTLDYILEKDYPSLPFDMYAKAKMQQISKEGLLNIDIFKNQLYDNYEKGFLRDVGEGALLDMLQFVPNYDIKKMGKLPIGNNSSLRVEHDFLPQNRGVKIDGKRFVSVVHYAYYGMISNLLETKPLPGLSLDTFDINTISLKDLVPTFENIQKDWVLHNVKNNNEIATSAKFDQYSILAHLLISTRDRRLLWKDETDPILGTGFENTGANNMGLFLEFLRNRFLSNFQNIPNGFLSGSISDNVFMRDWMGYVASDFKNTMNMLVDPKTKDLELVYGVYGSSEKPLKKDIQYLKSIGLTDKEIEICFPLVIAMYLPLVKLSEQEITDVMANKYFVDTDTYYLDQELLKKNSELAVEKLMNLSKSLILADGVTPEIFAYSVLANKRSAFIEDAKYDRINVWAGPF